MKTWSSRLVSAIRGGLSKSVLALGVTGVLFSGLLAGCAGNTAGTTATSTSTAPLIVGDPAIEASYAGGLATLLPTFLDPLNIQTGESIQFNLVGYTATGARVVLDSSGWTTSDVDGTYVLISGNSGVLTSLNRQTPSAYVVSTRYNDRDYSAFFRIKPRYVRLTGSVIDSTSGLAVRNVELYFYNDTQQLIGSAKTNYDGSFKAAVPANATYFQVVNDSLSSIYRRAVKYAPGLPPVRFPRPAYLDNRNAAGVVQPITIDASELAGLETFRTGAQGEELIPLASEAFTVADYFLAKPIYLLRN